MFKLSNVIQNYAWGSKTAMNALFGINNPGNLPQAELWMGAHPNGCSQISNQGESQLLSTYIDQSPEHILGRYTQARYGELPFLMKVLSADKPLSIQVHPEKSKAMQGFARENEAGIPLDAPERNYKDPNHKPEMVYALTNYKAMNGFRVISEMVELFEQSGCIALKQDVEELKAYPTPIQLGMFFRRFISLSGDEKTLAISQLMTGIDNKGASGKAREAFGLIAEFAQEYPDDVGLFAPLMLNVIELTAGEAMFLDAETPHAYIKGTGIEIMASSDNVLRAGLTPKHMDVEELLKNTRFEPIPYEFLKLKPQVQGHKERYLVPVDDFGFEVLTLTEDTHTEYVRSAEILLCLQGELTLKTADSTLTLRTGESAMIPEWCATYQYSGIGKAVRAFN
ncbi:mannose-6-phosphate isomerase, class I [Photobacterium sanctipauli]|uniref:Mannose-6-phosphate isomerase n=1 Tax=Photobacterium sanctipauli TaxID=1342794 RepID=A0A2T3P0V1_9GAMM|nr:mannose-6-phosphate isomerase, class I [Photobacterium sanctipauli]PSW22130.1 mannose-6-phosphate isomerase, class I [Photobacterium sanctipauli]